ncbi:hypothetical protein LSUE1_G002849 [Lachnellula suecica]|uniref:Uncharacterized protein n=1 Tax=Lachnellula suecica TaxID=602035 RepID=A0A8T9C703_9HELO|nr:hypothetical protein LSUE1_G002849 [Lachnellula suecica]
MAPSPPPQTNPPKRPIGIIPSPNHDSDSDPESDSDLATPRYLPPNPQELASQRLLDQLKSAVVEGYPSTGNYCCGGNIPISAHPSVSPKDSSKTPIVSPPIVLRFDTTTGGTAKLRFPPDPEDEKGKGKQRDANEELLACCTTEVAAEDDGGARDESRGRSARLDRESFAVDFHPSDFGILDAIKQVLLPGARFGSDGAEAVKGKGKAEEGNESYCKRKEHWGVRAELSQLNLPGGDQVITHPSPSTHKHFHLLAQKSPSTRFPTSLQKPSLSWTAFLRTSTHSILPISSGNLITLTYNLHITEATGGPLQRYPTVDPRLYPLFKVAKSLLENPDFLPEGGPLGIYCTHPYFHTRKLTQTLMPYCLRGIDAITLSVFRALGLKVLVAPVLGDEAWDEWEQAREEQWMRKMYSESSDEAMGEEEEGESNGNGEKTRMGLAWHKMRIVSGEGGEGFAVGGDPTSFINHHYPLHTLPSVTWLNDSSPHWEIAMVNLKHTPSSTPPATDTEIMWQYSHAAILVNIPALPERKERQVSR